MKLGVIPDYREENWPSMDLVAEQLLTEIALGHCGDVRVINLRPPYQRYFSRIPLLGESGIARNADRYINRMRQYPAILAEYHNEFDAFHICDHAYANAVEALPPQRCGVFCHDLDTFRCLFEPEKEPRSRWFKNMMRRVLDGMQKAALIFHTTQEIRRQILSRDVVDEKKLVHAPLGVSSAFTPGQAAEDFTGALAGIERPFILHVGSCIARKRIDVLLEVFAGLRATHTELALVKVGGEFTQPQRAQIRALNLDRHLIHLTALSQAEIAGLYRRARGVLLPSDAEGFGLPVIEALACGAVVVASGIASLREAGGEAAVYCEVGNVQEWVAAVERILHGGGAPDRGTRLAQAGKFSWTAHAATICDAYRRLTGS